ncbi:MAG: hypothetical protein KDI36_13100 [Pseudomonadales bacterium]|nr:hypothetical protein [Pseudomonadales bacterium]
MPENKPPESESPAPERRKASQDRRQAIDRRGNDRVVEDPYPRRVKPDRRQSQDS